MNSIESYKLQGINNPLVKQRADPWLYKHKDNWYYFTASVPEYDRIEIRKCRKLSELPETKPVTIWKKYESGEMSQHIWAPEIHYINGKWYIYFAAGKAESVWDIGLYVLENDSEDPTTGNWIEKGRINTGASHFYLDATVFTHKQKLYMIWAQKPDGDPDVSNLYITEMETPWKIAGEPVLLSRPEYEWEQRLFHVNEGPAVLIRSGYIFLTYSASGTDYNYCMGLLKASEKSDLLDPASWEKSPEPVFQSSDKNGIYGPGHSCFSRTEDDRTDILVYHARSYKEVKGDPLYDPNRHTRIQKILWDSYGNPVFGKPIPDSE